jgi:MFS family permease
MATETVPQLTAAASGPSTPDRRRAPALPVVLTVHVLFTLLYAALFSNVIWLMPLLVRLQFGSADPQWRDWQTIGVTAAIPTFMTLSIFWGELLRHMSIRRYLSIFWVAAAMPLGCVALVQNYWQLLVLHVIAAAGTAGWMPVNGRLLKHFYPDQARGRAYAVINIATLGGAVLASYWVGLWMESHPQAFRVYFPIASAAQLLGIAILLWLVRRTSAEHQLEPQPAPSLAAVLRPVLHMGAVLRADRPFQRYEKAFMTYGAAYMLCDGLLPVLATARLGMRYEDYAHSTQTISRLVMLLVMLPSGWLLDRIGPVRVSGLAFAVLCVYPVLLLSAATPADVALASAVWGVGMAGVMMGWMLGPMMLAGTPDKVPVYVAIHATLVGIRGILFETLGMALYQFTHSFVWPLIAAAIAFAWAAVQMWRLHRLTRLPLLPAPKPAPIEIAAPVAEWTPRPAAATTPSPPQSLRTS